MTFKHGTNGYCNYNCRCSVCRKDWADYNSKRRRERAADPTLKVPHGTGGGYQNYMCRCDLCRLAHNGIRNKQRENRRASQS